MNMKPATLVLFLAGIGAIMAEKGHGDAKDVGFCYRDEDGCGPSTSAWPQMCHVGQRQSPIDLPVESDVTGPMFLRLIRAYKGKSFRMQNNGHSVSIDFVGESGQNEGRTAKTFLFPDPLNFNTIRKYKFASVHFHWGRNDTIGSEHTVKGVSTSMEAHFVHYLANYSTLAEAIASGHESALSVLGLFIDAKSEGASSMAPIVENLKLVKEPSHDGEVVTVNKPLDFTPMLLAHGKNRTVSTYKGSLTTPGCNEQANWFVLRIPAPVPESHLEAFRSTIKDSRGNILNENHRPVLALHERKVSHKLVKATE